MKEMVKKVKLKIGIVTFHMAWNYGAVLQCAALSTVLEKRGHDVRIINYVPDYSEERIFRNPIKEGMKLYHELSNKGKAYRIARALRRTIRRVLDVRIIGDRKKINNVFQKFQLEHFHLTRRFHSLEELRADPPDFDVYISGSDQLWNSSLTNGALDPVYFLQFGPKTAKRIAYAVSACNVHEKMKNTFAQMLPNFDYISLRESKFQDKISLWGNKQVYINPDPTVLLDAEEYERMEQPILLQTPFVFIYLLSKEGAVTQCEMLVDTLNQNRNLTIIDGSPNSFCKIPGLRNMKVLSPGEWLYLIHHADYVITNSFHCMVLSTIFRKNLFILPCTPSRIERLEEFAEYAGLKDRIVYNPEDVGHAVNNKIDFFAFEAYQKHMQNTADRFLDMVLQ